MPASRMILPDVIKPGLRVVFCGTAVGAVSARRHAYYAGPGNKFWPTLREIGLTPRRLQPTECASVLHYGVGLTDVCKQRSGSDLQVGVQGFDVQRLAGLIRENAPLIIAFNGVKAGRASLQRFESTDDNHPALPAQRLGFCRRLRGRQAAGGT